MKRVDRSPARIHVPRRVRVPNAFPGLAQTDAVIDEIVDAAGRAALRIAATL